MKLRNETFNANVTNRKLDFVWWIDIFYRESKDPKR